jgi:hypothetical protein
MSDKSPVFKHDGKLLPEWTDYFAEDGTAIYMRRYDYKDGTELHIFYNRRMDNWDRIFNTKTRELGTLGCLWA